MEQDGARGVSTDPDDLPLPRTYAPDDDPLRALCALSVIPADICSDWVRIGMALYATLHDSKNPEVRSRAAEIGYEIFDTWSKRSSKYDADAVREKWFRECVKVHSVGAGTPYRTANEHNRRWSDVYADMLAGSAARW